ncbi:hypothetical protein SERLADRAFT_434019 [Serpula lacrymans var. lacrymans S7.9]|nr:uncharacterized protein SERLADRAFT_434019 [Serpula lacrymans var. lacrymans S7.9]EGO28164.1 hypothetical protein SERLADRAFT_434019 [Serpula lacrymans var. lacrymans S7.9]
MADSVACSTMYDLMMFSCTSATKICYLFLNKQDSPAYGSSDALSQKFVHGNVVVFPQDSVHLRNVLPPAHDDLSDAMCTLFVGVATKPCRENIAKLRPVLVSKHRVATMIKFLVENNIWYQNAGVCFSPDNLQDSFTESSNEAVPVAIDICHLPTDRGADTSTAGYMNNESDDSLPFSDDNGSPLMDAVGYSAGDYTPSNFKLVKAEALAHVLDGKKFICMPNGSHFMNNCDPGLLTFLFPHLDPLGIGGFHDPRRHRD